MLRRQDIENDECDSRQSNSSQDVFSEQTNTVTGPIQRQTLLKAGSGMSKTMYETASRERHVEILQPEDEENGIVATSWRNKGSIPLNVSLSVVAGFFTAGPVGALVGALASFAYNVIVATSWRNKGSIPLSVSLSAVAGFFTAGPVGALVGALASFAYNGIVATSWRDKGSIPFSVSLSFVAGWATAGPVGGFLAAIASFAYNLF